MYHYDETLKMFDSDAASHAHSEATTNEYDISETMFCNYGDMFEVSPALSAPTFSSHGKIFLKTSEMNDVKNGDEAFEACMEAMENMAVTRHRNGDGN